VSQKDNAQYSSISELPLLDDDTEILKDEIIEVNYTIETQNVISKNKLQLRRIAYYSPKHDNTFIY